MDMRISDAELEVMEALWAAGQPLTAAEVADRIDSTRDWSLATVKTMLSRLAAKGASPHREDGRRFLYSPAIKREDYVGHEFEAVRRTVVRRPSIAAGRAAGRRGCTRRRGHRRDRGAAEGAEVVTDWLLGTLLATTGADCPGAVDPRTGAPPLRCPGGLWPVADPRGAPADADDHPDGRADRSRHRLSSSLLRARKHRSSRCCSPQWRRRSRR